MPACCHSSAGDADESGEESTCQDGGCVVGGVCGFTFDSEGVAVVGASAKDWSHAVRASS